MIKYLIKDIRKTEGMSQKDLARYSGVSESKISAIERNKRDPTIPVACQLAKALHVEIKALFENVEE